MTGVHGVARIVATAGALALAPLAGNAQNICPEPAAVTGESEGVLAHVRYLADDALEGRDTGSPGERCAASYLVERFRSHGLVPAPGADGWFQSFDVRTGSRVLGGGLEIAGVGDGALPDDDVRPWGFSSSGEARGEVVYAGPGVSHPGSGEILAEVEGKIAVVEGGAMGSTGFYADPHFRASVMAGRGALGVILLLPEGQELPDPSTETRPAVGIPALAVTAEHAAAIRRAAGHGPAEGRIEARVEPLLSEARNVVAYLPGSDPELRDEVVVIGAHYDHLGWGGEGSLAPDDRSIHNGADDNASGTAALVEAARVLSQGPAPARSVLFIAFSGEEKGLLGSAHYVDEPLLSLEKTVAMINMDMVGRLRENVLTVFGLATAEEWDGVLDEANAAGGDPFELSKLPDGFGPSDHSSFYGKGIPVLHLFTNTHTEYHRPSDDWETIDADGVERIAHFAADVALALAGTPDRMAASLTPRTGAGNPHGGDAPSSTTGGGYGPYLGTIPDMAPTDHGVRLTGVREESPAERAGLRAGDLIVEFAGREITDLYAYTYALRDHAPGDTVEIVVEREGERVSLSAMLGERR